MDLCLPLSQVDDAITDEESRMRPHIESLTRTITELKEEIELTADKFDKYKVEREEAIRRDRGVPYAVCREWDAEPSMRRHDGGKPVQYV